MTDLLCKACGKKLYDSKTNLRYWFNYWDKDEVDRVNRYKFGCIHCGHKYTYAEKRTWSAGACAASVDVPVFDARSEEHGLCPPTVFKRFQKRLDELSKADRDIQNAQELLETVWNEWRAEQED